MPGETDIGQSVAIHRVAAPGEIAGEPVLQRGFLAAAGGEADDVLQKGDLLIEHGINGVAQSIGHQGGFLVAVR